MKATLFGVTIVGLLCFALLVGMSGSAQQKKSSTKKAQIERGKYFVHAGGCNDCHSPKVFTPTGPIPDTSRLLSGHPAGTKLPQVPQGVLGADQWGALASNDLTAWAGPWGISFTRNLTPDVATGIGSWTEDIFVKAIRTGKDMGEGRDILPPMPWPEYRNLTDEDLKAIFAYLMSLKPIENVVPDPISPTGQRLPTMSGPKK